MSLLCLDCMAYGYKRDTVGAGFSVYPNRISDPWLMYGFPWGKFTLSNNLNFRSHITLTGQCHEITTAIYFPLWKFAFFYLTRRDPCNKISNINIFIHLKKLKKTGQLCCCMPNNQLSLSLHFKHASSKIQLKWDCPENLNAKWNFQSMKIHNQIWKLDE